MLPVLPASASPSPTQPASCWPPATAPPLLSLAVQVCQMLRAAAQTQWAGRGRGKEFGFFFFNFGLHPHGLLTLHSLTNDQTCVSTLEGKVLMTGPLRKVLARTYFFPSTSSLFLSPPSLLLVSWQKKPGETRCQP